MKKDILSNYINQGINIVARFILIPILLIKLGTSAYGLIGFYFTIESTLVFLDFGIGSASARFLADKTESNMVYKFSLIKKIEMIYIGLATLASLSIFLLSSFLSKHWLTIDNPQLNGEKIVQLMSLLFLVSWPKSLYENFMSGQFLLYQKNIINSIFTILRSVSLFILFYFFKGTLEHYFIILILFNFLEVIGLRIRAFKQSPAEISPIDGMQIKYFLLSCAGIGVFSMLSLVYFQLDKIYISKAMTSSELAYYNLSFTLPLALLSLLYPISSSLFPRLTNFKNDQYHSTFFIKWFTLLLIVILTYLSTLYVYSYWILDLWLGQNNSSVNITLLIYSCAGIFFYGCSLLFQNLYIANYKSNVLNKAFLFSSLFYILFILLTKPNLQQTAIAWTISSFIVFMSLMFEFYSTYNSIASQLLFYAIKIISIFILFIIIHRLYFQYNENNICISLIGNVILSLLLIPLTFKVLPSFVQDDIKHFIQEKKSWL
ncbi:MAG TPA: hypothetical protein PK006_04195 [Saprospiraceae bacterium]|nr:hypothetical protein [Saprospiraceae bacterium]